MGREGRTGIFFPRDIRLWDQCNVEAFLDLHGATRFVPALLAAGFTDGPALATLDLHTLEGAGVNDPRARIALLRAVYVAAGMHDQVLVLDEVLAQSGLALDCKAGEVTLIRTADGRVKRRRRRRKRASPGCEPKHDVPQQPRRLGPKALARAIAPPDSDQALQYLLSPFEYAQFLEWRAGGMQSGSGGSGLPGGEGGVSLDGAARGGGSHQGTGTGGNGGSGESGGSGGSGSGTAWTTAAIRSTTASTTHLLGVQHSVGQGSILCILFVVIYVIVVSALNDCME